MGLIYLLAIAESHDFADGDEELNRNLAVASTNNALEPIRNDKVGPEIAISRCSDSKHLLGRRICYARTQGKGAGRL